MSKGQNIDGGTLTCPNLNLIAIDMNVVTFMKT